MKKIEEKIKQLEAQILENHVNKEKELLITEMKKIGIEKLPYSYTALKQFIDPETMEFHYNKHYKGYVDKLNSALAKKKYGDLDLEKIIKTISRYDKTIRNNAGGAFNHALFWNMLTPKPKRLTGDLLKKINSQFGSFVKFKNKFEEIAKERFGSGWVWLVLTSRNTLKIMSTPNQDNPLMNVIEGGGFPLLGLDLWEHAYYLKYRNKRDEYIVNFWKVVNWDFVSKMYEMKTETKLLESRELKKLLSEGKSETCSTEEVRFYAELFSKNKKVKWEYKEAIDKIIREIFNEYWVQNPENNELPGVYNLERPGRSKINKLNTNFNCFCILLKDMNKVLLKNNEEPIIFSKDDEVQQIREVRRFIKLLEDYKDRIFDMKSSTLQNLLITLEIKDTQGAKREEISAAILRKSLGKDYKIEVIGGPGRKEDALQGIDIKITYKGITKTAQVKGFRDTEEFEDVITIIGAGDVKKYSTDYMIFQRGKNVLLFRNDGEIVDGNYTFKKTSLLYKV